MNQESDLLSKYGNLKQKISYEGGLDYYLRHYTTPQDAAGFDEELLSLMENCEFFLNEVYSLIDQRIIDHGGDPTGWEY